MYKSVMVVSGIVVNPQPKQVNVHTLRLEMGLFLEFPNSKRMYIYKIEIQIEIQMYQRYLQILKLIK